MGKNAQRIDYFTSKIEIKPQLNAAITALYCDYFTSKIEIKPQPLKSTASFAADYFTSKIEIKPQHGRRRTGPQHEKRI